MLLRRPPAQRAKLPLLPLLLGLLLALPGVAGADPAVTQDALDRLEELLELRQEDGLLDARAVLPTLLVSAQPRYEESVASYPAQALGVLIRVFGAAGVRVCEACGSSRTVVQDGRLEQSSGPACLDELIRLDDRFRGEALRARTATWVDETASGVALRIVDLRSGGVVCAFNVDPELQEYQGARRTFRLAAEVERRTRGEALAHVFYDLGLYPGQHVAMTWNDQFGETNANLAGLVLSFYDPVVGLGVSYGRALQSGNLLLGGQLILSVPTVIGQSMSGSDEEVVDPLFTGVLTLHVPFGRSNYAGLLTVSTNGEVALGIALLNTSFIPVLP